MNEAHHPLTLFSVLSHHLSLSSTFSLIVAVPSRKISLDFRYFQSDRSLDLFATKKNERDFWIPNTLTNRKPYFAFFSSDGEIEREICFTALDLGFSPFESRVSRFWIDGSSQGPSLDRWRIIMHGFSGDDSKHNRHMWPVPANATTVAIDSSPSLFICKVYTITHIHKSNPNCYWLLSLSIDFYFPRAFVVISCRLWLELLILNFNWRKFR